MNQARSAYINARDDYRVPHDLLREVGRYRVVRPRVELERPQYDIIAPREQAIVAPGGATRMTTFWGLCGTGYTIESALTLAREMHRKDEARAEERRAEAEQSRQRKATRAAEEEEKQKHEDRRRRARAVDAARRLVAAEDERLRNLADARRLIAEWDAENDNGRVRP